MLTYDTKLRIIEEYSKKFMGNDFAHGYPHVLRVLKWAKRIVENENIEINEFVLKASIYLHDIGRCLGEPHAYYSAILARGLLLELGVEKEIIEKIANAILYHSYSYAKTHNIKPLSLEALVLSDADKLDALGIVGFARVFWFGAQKNQDLEKILEHFENKIFKLKERLHFPYSKKIAERLERRIKRALEELYEEIEFGAGAGI